jgi:hypothetical protein
MNIEKYKNKTQYLSNREIKHNKSKNHLPVFLPVLPVSEVWNMGYSAPWTLLNNLISSPGENFISRFFQ